MFKKVNEKMYPKRVPNKIKNKNIFLAYIFIYISFFEESGFTGLSQLNINSMNVDIQTC